MVYWNSIELIRILLLLLDIAIYIFHGHVAQWHITANAFVFLGIKYFDVDC